MIATAEYAPFVIVLLEKHNHLLTNILLKFKYEKKCSCEINIHAGFGAYQLVFSRNPNFPANYVNKPPALDRTAASKTIDEHVCALYAAREAFMRKDHESLKRNKSTLTPDRVIG